MPSSVVDFRLLGPLRVTVDGVPVAVGGPRQMAVLARLMLTPDQVVTMDQLVESVWDGDEPARPHVAIRSYVSNLRRVIEPNRRRRASDSCLASSPPGYRLAIDPASVDWVRFERQVEAGRAKLAVGDHRAAIDHLRRADELWKGDPCSGLPESQIFLGHRGRMTKLRETAVELLFEASLRHGDHAFVVSQVEAAIAEHPLRERLTELGMIALYRAGRQSEALALGRQLRARLLEGLGIDPSPAIGALELQILNHDPVLGRAAGSVDPVSAGPPPPQEPPGSPSAPLQGAGPSLAASPLAAIAVDDSLGPVGRRHELAALDRIGPTLEAGRSMTVIMTGEQGIGKTTLASAAASRLADRNVTVAWARGVQGQTAAFWPWSQLLLGLLERVESSEWSAIVPDLMPLRALGPSVVAALGLDREAPVAAGDAAPRSDDPDRPEDQADPENTVSSKDTASSGDSKDSASSKDTVSSGDSKDSGDPEGLALSDRRGVFDRAEVMLTVTTLLDRLARRRPLALVFEDLQWADEESIKLASYAASALLESPVAFIFTWRETDIELGSAAPGLREMVRLPRMIRLELDGLDVAAVSELAALADQPLGPEDCERIQYLCAGNPLFIREMLLHNGLEIGGGHRWSTLVDAVRDRVEQLDPEALPLLSAAALFRDPFTLAGLAAAAGRVSERAGELLNLCVRGGILVDADTIAGTYRFGHPVIAEVLSTELLAAERAAIHKLIGHHLAGMPEDVIESSFHLSRSPDAEDRVLAARMCLDRLAENRFDPGHLSQIDEVVSIGMSAADVLAVNRSPALRDGFAVDALTYLSWRAWIDGRPTEWLEDGTRALALATAMVAETGTKTVARTKVPTMASLARPVEGIEPGRSTDRVTRSVLNLLGMPMLPIGPTSTAGFAAPELTHRLHELAEVSESVGGDNLIRHLVQIHLGHDEMLTKPGANSVAKAIKEAQKVVAGARRRLPPEEAAIVQMLMVNRFADQLDPSAKVDALAEIVTMRPGLPSAVFRARHGYPALLELGRTYDAQRLVTQVHGDVLSRGGAFLKAEARLLLIRHLIWTGQVDSAELELQQALQQWTAMGLAEPVPLIRQLRAVRLLDRRRLAAGHGPDSHHQLMAERASAPELALRLARLGDTKRANECLNATVEGSGVRLVSRHEQALLTMAAAQLQNQKAARMVYDLLLAEGDRPVVRPDGSVVFGPASLYAAIAAQTCGIEERVEGHLQQAGAALLRYGGSPNSMDTVLSDVGMTSFSN